ncbi:MAG TPA: hypothetical protein PLP50_16125 [Thermoanaerobaculia bacterium]|jgi:hypothetical protein|nr:hypothetical protein [Thermoanaerobaculia bacterium]HPA53122.1 hypothetical protein [Thermoanaerobaculia bacterium]
MHDTIPRRTTTPCAATVQLDDGSRLDVTFWLLPDSHRERGVTPMRVLLEEDRRFLPIGLAGGGSCLLSRDAIVSVAIEADGPGAEPTPPEGAALDLVTLHLVSGEEVSGVLTTTALEGHGRMSDVFNLAGRFVPVGVGAQLVFVATSRIARVSF